MRIPRFHPKLLDTLPGYTRTQAIADISAGITVGVLALPLAMAFSIASGMSPAAGIWTAIVAGLIISAFGGSRVQIGGPTGAFIPIIYGIVAHHGVQNLLIATLLAGVMLFLMGVFRLGNMIRFIPVAVVIGFTNGIAVTIFISQIKDFLGLAIPDPPGEFFGKMRALYAGLPSISWPTVAVGVGSLVFLLAWNRIAQKIRWMRRLPGPLAVLIVMTALNAILAWPVATIGSRFGGIPQGLPAFALPELHLSSLGALIPPAITIALLGAIESLLSARVADQAIDDRHAPNQELMAQGLANMAAPLVGGFAATGAIARTATNIRTGGRTPIAGIVHSFVLLLIALLAAPLAQPIPLATLSAIVVVVSINMGEWHAFRLETLRRFSRYYRTTLLGVFFVTVVFDLTLAVELGMALASLFFIHRMSDLTQIERVPLEDFYGHSTIFHADGRPKIGAYKLIGSLFFGTTNKLENLMLQSGEPDVLILDMSKVVNLDSTGLDIFFTILKRTRKYNGHLILCGINSQPYNILMRSKFLTQLGEDNICENLTDALVRAQTLSANVESTT